MEEEWDECKEEEEKEEEDDNDNDWIFAKSCLHHYDFLFALFQCFLVNIVVC